MNQQQPYQGQKRILEVVDEPHITRLWSLALEYYGFKVDIFNDSEMALSNFKRDYYDLVILDIKMPNMDGFELYDELKKKLYYEERKNIMQ
jgi:DNA-binding response OmpR family regulator